MITVGRLIPFFTGKEGGPYNHIIELTYQLEKMGVNTLVYTTSHISQKGKSRTEFFEKKSDKFKIYRFNSYLKFRDYRVSFRTITHLFEKVKSIDILHSHGIRSYQEDIGSLISLIKNKPFVITPHGAISMNVNYSDKIPKMIYDITLGYLKKKLLNFHFVAVAKNEIPIIKKYGIDDNCIHYIPHGINTNIFKPVDSKDLKKKYNLDDSEIILYVGRINKIKGIDRLIKILKLIIKKNINVKLMIVGGDAGYLPIVKKLIHKYDLYDHIIFTGFISKYLLPKYYSIADLVVYPSRQEIFGHVIAEAGACGKVVIGPDIMGPKEVIANGKSGYTSNFKDLEKLSELILELLDDKEKLKKMGNYAIKRVKEKYSWKKAAVSHIKLYKSLLS